MADYQIELDEKDQVIEKLKTSENTMRERLKKKTAKTELTYFYEQQLEEKDFKISELNEKIAKLYEKLRVESNNESFDKKNSDDKLNSLIKENNQLKNELNRVNLELEKLESNFTMQVDEYEIEIENITNKLKDKENTIRNLIISAEEKDDMIVKLKSKFMSDEDSILKCDLSESVLLNESENQDTDSQQRKTKGLIKLIEEKNQQIETLKTELNEFKQSKHGSTHDISNTSFPNNKCFMTSSTVSFPNQNNYKFVMDLLEKEVQIYQKLNSNENTTSTKSTLAEVTNLRNQLLKMTILRENRALSSASQYSSSTECVNSEENQKSSNDNKDGILTIVSPRNNWKHDSGITSQKSDTTIESNALISPSSSNNRLVRASSIPRLINTLSPTGLSNTKVSEFALKNHSREDLISLIQHINNENSIIKRQLENKGPKLTEIHKELSKLRDQLKSSEKINEYLRKELELHDITHGNAESLFEMAQKLNLTKEELEQYKLKLVKVREESKTLNVSNLANSLSSKLNEIYSNQDNEQNVPTQNIKVTVATLEKELEDLKTKYHRLQDWYNNSERTARYLAIKFNKYMPYLNELGLEKKNNLKRSLSDPNFLKSSQIESLRDKELNKLVSNILVDVKKSKKNTPEKSKSSDETQNFDVINEFKMQNFKLKMDEKNNLIDQYYEKLSYIYNGFKGLKAQSKYLKQIFGENLYNKLQENTIEGKMSDNLVHNIFNGAFTKFEALNKELENKTSMIENIQKELEDLKLTKKTSETSSSDVSESSKSSKTSSLNPEILDLHIKVKKYHDENLKLKEKIKIQNSEIEEAIQQLMIYNKEKENTRILLNSKKEDKKSFLRRLNDDGFISEKLSKTHSKLRKARDNFQNKIENNEKALE